MKSVVFASLLVLLMARDTNAQDPMDRMRNTEVHLGVGFHQLVHVGGRFRVDPFILLEVDVGGYPFNEKLFHFPLTTYNIPNTFSFGVTAVPRAAQRNPGFIYTAQYTLWVDRFRWGQFMHFVSGNIGWITQHSSGISFLARLGAGWAFDDYDFRGHDGRIHHANNVRFFPNIEIALGYAF